MYVVKVCERIGEIMVSGLGVVSMDYVNTVLGVLCRRLCIAI